MTRNTFLTIIMALAFLIPSIDAQAGGCCGGDRSRRPSGPRCCNTSKCFNPFECDCEGDCYQPYQKLLCCDFFNLEIGAQGLYWTVCQSRLDYAADINGATEHTHLIGPGKMHFLEYDWKGGFRLWLGFDVPCWCADFRIIYTNYCNDSDDSTSGVQGDRHLIATLLHPNTQRCEALSASIKNKLEYQTLDFPVGYNTTFCCDQLHFHPFCGVRLLELKQKLKADYTDIEFEEFPTQVKLHSELKGIGLHGGADFALTLCKGFSLYSGVAGSILASKTDEKHKQHILDEQGNVVTTEIDLKEDQCVCVPGYNIFCGVNWACDFDYGRSIAITVGYEFNHWFNTPRLRRYMGEDCPGTNTGSTSNDIGFHGLSAGLTASF